jgi:protein involved in polysaccharide export with SLBB domain
VFVDEILDRFANRVTITGAVWRPGEYELKEGMTLSTLIMEAEGLRPEVFRSRALINRLTDNMDFSILAFNVDDVLNNPGRYDILLRNEDEVIIRSIHEMREEMNVAIHGEVQKAGNYQYREDMTLEDLILKAEGFRNSASEARIEVFRRITGHPSPETRGSRLAETFTFEVERNLTMHELARSFKLEPYDQVYVRRRPDYQVQQSVKIEGEVMYPGAYTLSDRNERVSDLVKRAGGLTVEAYVPGATLTRQALQLERTGANLEGVLALGEDEGEETPDNQINYIGIDLGRILNRPGSVDDVFLRPGDVIKIPAELQTVRVNGGVLRDSEIRHIDGKRIRYYVNRSGGYSEDARKRSAYVVYANGDVSARRNFLVFSSVPEVTPGAEIIIPRKVEKQRLSPGERISILSSVVTMSAVVLTAISRF